MCMEGTAYYVDERNLTMTGMSSIHLIVHYYDTTILCTGNVHRCHGGQMFEDNWSGTQVN